MAIVTPTLVVASVGLYLAVVTTLVLRYVWTHDIGFVWLGLAVVVWPQFSGVLTRWQNLVISRLSSSWLTAGDLMIIVLYGRQIIGSALLLAAVSLLSKAKPAVRGRVGTSN